MKKKGQSAGSTSDRHDRSSIQLKESYGTGLWRKEFSFRIGEVNPGDRCSWPEALLSLVLPHGYPDSVTSDYVPFQFWDTVQALSTYLRGILCQQSLLLGLGVGDASASAVSAALSWTLISGMSMLGGIIFAFQISVEFGADPKRWRLFADVINDIGLTLTLFAPLTGPLFLILACLGSICTAVCGVAAGATKAAIAQHFVKRKSNATLISDIHAKEGTQETIVSVSGLVLGSALAFVIGESLLLRWAVYLSLTAIHIIANYFAVISLCFNTLNEQRASIVIDHFSKHGTILSPSEVSRHELVWRRPALAPISMGVPLHSLVFNDKTYEWYQTAIAQNPSKHYILHQSSESVSVLFHDCADSIDILQAFFEANRACKIGIKAAKKEFESSFSLYLSELKRKEWVVDQLMISDGSWRCRWDKQ